METLGNADLMLLYNKERKYIIEDLQERDKKTAAVMRAGIAHAPDVMDEATVRKFEEICEICMYRALKNLRNKYFGQEKDCHTWIGINPHVLGDESPQLKNLWDKTLGVLGSYKCIPSTGVAFAVERNTKNGIRPHVYLMIVGEQKERPAHIAKTLAKYYGCASNLIDVKKFKRKEMYEEHLKYIKGHKASDKIPFVEADKRDRIKENVENYYLSL